jgi:hypothetical protein
MIYLDSAAVVRLAHAEAESQALRDWLDERVDLPWISSTLVEIESFRALSRHAPAAVTRLHPVLDLMELVEIDAGVRIRAQTVRPATIRGLDAVHLATALGVGSKLTAFVTYDKRLADAARGAGLRVEMPSQR